MLVLDKPQKYGLKKQGEKKPTPELNFDENKEPVLTPFEAELFSMISDVWQGYLLGEERNIAEIVKEHSKELSEIALAEQNSAWSEEDENRFRNLIYLVECSNEGKGTKEGFVKFINRLKSLKDRFTWKPSKEQLYALLDAKDRVTVTKGEALKSLYNDLKKLREE